MANEGKKPHIAYATVESATVMLTAAHPTCWGKSFLR
jgi:hypothetical protein